MLGGIVKPKTGLDIQTLKEVCANMVKGGVDFIKEDEILGNPSCCPFEERVKIQTKLESLPRNSSKLRFRNSCFVSGRPRGVYSKFNLSTIAIRDMAGKGQIPGLTKASW